MKHSAFRTASVAVLAVSLLSLGAPSLHAQAAASVSSSVPDSVRVERLAALGRLWGAVKYFHPALATRPVDWDSALVATIPKVRAARTRGEYAAAVDAMLAALGDPATHVLASTPSVQLAGSTRGGASQGAAATSGRWTPDSTYVITIPNPTEFTTVSQALGGMQADLARAPRVVFDLRTHGAERETGYVGLILGMSGVSSMLTAAPIAAPAVRSRMYSGFPTQVGVTSGGYFAGWMEKAGEVITPGPGGRAPRVGFVVDAHSDLPPVALALQQAGSGVIVADGAEARAGVANAQNVWTTTVADSVRVAVRVSELVTADGTGGQPDTVIAAAANSDAARDPALDAALALVRAPARARKPQAAGTRFTPAPENAYREMRFPAVEYRLLAAYRFWNAINYFYPYKALTGENWNRVLVNAIPEFEAARDSTEYGVAVAHLVTHIHDSHAFVSTMTLAPFRGRMSPPVKVRYVEGKPVVIELSKDTAVARLDIHVGDIVVQADDVTVEARRAKLEPIFSYSTPQALDRTIAMWLMNGPEGKDAKLVVRGAGGRERVAYVPRRIPLVMAMRFTREGGPWRILPGNIGYVDLEKLTVVQVDSMFDALRDTRAIIFDNRSYPQGTMWAIGPRLTDKHDAPVARWQRPVVTSPDTSEWDVHGFVQTVSASDKWRYAKPTVMLVDERTMSQAEHTALYFRAANGTTIIGSPTMGADGDVTSVVLPAGVTANFTGYDVRRADGSQLQRIGITPDILVRPTIAGIRAGRDEVLERAVKFVQEGR